MIKFCFNFVFKEVNTMLVMKFGGTSVSSVKSIEAICQIVKQNMEYKPVVIVSALSKVTDSLVNLCNIENQAHLDNLLAEIYAKHGELSKKFLTAATQKKVLTYIDNCLKDVKTKLTKFYNKHKTSASLMLKDEIVASGEKSSSFLISHILNEYGQIKAKPVIATNCIITNKKFGAADFLLPQTRKATKAAILPLLDRNIVPVITGFIGATRDGETTTLGRGGSDYSASIIGFALDSQEIQIWTDVDGVYSADPRQIKSVKLLSVLTYNEASELAVLGAKVLHPRTIMPAIKSNIPVRVLNTFNLASSGTLIINEVKEEFSRVKAITSKLAVPLITIQSNDMFLGKGFLKNVFAIFTKFGLSVNLVSVSEVSVSVTFDNLDSLDEALELVSKFAQVERDDVHGSLSLVGNNLSAVPNLMRDIFTILESAKIPVNMLSYSAININVSMVLKSRDINKALQLLHTHFID